jgi:hypothetical protein
MRFAQIFPRTNEPNASIRQPFRVSSNASLP